jgi:glycosyltransferase involved in cell wall biosynthesis
MPWICPTYNRPESIKRVLTQIKKLGVNSRIIVFVQGRDMAQEYYVVLKDFPFVEAHYLPINMGLCGALNHAFELYPDEEWYGLFTDDECIYTEGWDEKLIAAAGNCKISYGTDKDSNNGRIHTFNVIGGDLMRAVGYWAPRGLWHWYFDDVWEKLAEACDLRRPVLDVITEHKHYLYGKAPKDKTYMVGESRAQEDKRIFCIWLEEEFPKVVEQIKKGYYEVRGQVETTLP